MQARRSSGRPLAGVHPSGCVARDYACQRGIRTIPAPVPLLASVSLLRTCTLSALAVAVTGCATVTGEPMQDVSIVTVDAQDRPVDGLRCRVTNDSAVYVGNSPMFGLQVRRSSSDLQIECSRGVQVARGTAVSRGGLRGAANLVLPGGTALMAVDHLTGYRYTYPQLLRLKLGEHLIFDASDEVAGRPATGIQAEAPR